MIIIGVVGSRRRNEESDYKAVESKFVDIIWSLVKQKKVKKKSEIKICSGGCKKGADSFVKRLKELTGIDYYEHLPKLPEDYDDLPGQAKRWAYAKAAYARNTLIAQDSNILIACVAADRTGGTEDTVKKFTKIHKGTRKLVLV
jgi:hypothetical protein